MSKPNVVINSDNDSAAVTLVSNTKAKRKYTKPKAKAKSQAKPKTIENLNPKMFNSPAIKELETRRDALLENAGILTKTIDFLKSDYLV